jgi:2-hydroxychromene-2-carboxylate isomerase
VNSVKVMRGCIHLAPQGRLEAFARAAFHAYWGEDMDISKDEVVAEICRRAGVDGDDLFAGIARPEVKDQLRANTEEVVARGGFGSPTIFVGGTDMYFGNDRLPLVREAVLRARAEG